MRTVLIATVLIVGCLALPMVAGAADDELGKKVFTQKCVACHGPDGAGNPKTAQMLKVTIPPLSDAASKSDSELMKFIAEGKKPMPSFKTLSGDELGAVAHYVKELANGRTAGKK